MDVTYLNGEWWSEEALRELEKQLPIVEKKAGVEARHRRILNSALYPYAYHKQMEQEIWKSFKSLRERAFPFCEKDEKIFPGKTIKGEFLQVEAPTCTEGKTIGVFHTHPPSQLNISYGDYLASFTAGHRISCVGNIENTIIDKETGQKIPVSSIKCAAINVDHPVYDSCRLAIVSSGIILKLSRDLLIEGLRHGEHPPEELVEIYKEAETKMKHGIEMCKQYGIIIEEEPPAIYSEGTKVHREMIEKSEELERVLRRLL